MGFDPLVLKSFLKCVACNSNGFEYLILIRAMHCCRTECCAMGWFAAQCAVGDMNKMDFSYMLTFKHNIVWLFRILLIMQRQQLWLSLSSNDQHLQ